jgi:hypothetical protein
LSILVCSAGCHRQEKGKITIVDSDVFPIPALSGIEFDRNKWCFIDDTTGRLYMLNGKVDLFHPTHNRYRFQCTEVLKQSKKVDLEALTIFVWNGKTGVLALSSGTKWPNRNKGLLCKDIETEKTISIDLTAFYLQLMSAAKLKPEQLNIEGAAIHEKYLYLLNRGKNKLIRVSLAAFFGHLNGDPNDISFKVYNIDLPRIEGTEAGLSGAWIDSKNDCLYFTASVENTSEWTKDGNIMGSFVGCLYLQKLHNHMEPLCLPLKKNNQLIPVKLESIIGEKIEDKAKYFLVVSDGDGKPSHVMRIKWENRN